MRKKPNIPTTGPQPHYTRLARANPENCEGQPNEFLPGTWWVTHHSRTVKLSCLIKYEGKISCASPFCDTHVKTAYRLVHDPDFPVTEREFVRNHNIPVDFFQRSHCRVTEFGSYASHYCHTCDNAEFPLQ